MALSVGGTPITPEQLATLQADLGIVVAEEITARYTSLLGTDDSIFLRSGVPGLVSVDVMTAAFGDTPPQTLTQSSRFNNSQTFYAPTVTQPSSVTFVGAGTPYATVTSLTAHVIAVPAGLQVGDRLIVLTGDHAAASSVVTSEAQSMTQDLRRIGSIWSVVLTSVPTSVTINLAVSNDQTAQAIAYRGAGQIAGSADAEVFSARATIPYTSDAATAAVVGLYTRGHPNSATAAQFNGADAADHLYKVDFSVMGWFSGIHDGPTGSNNIDMTWSAADTGGHYACMAYKP